MIASASGDSPDSSSTGQAPPVALIPGLETEIPKEPRLVADAPAGQGLDDGQKAITTEVTDKIIAEILAIKGQYPELEHFGEAPWFTRGLGEFRYEYKLDNAILSGGRPLVLPGGCGMYFRLAAAELPPSKWSRVYGTVSAGGARAGISHEFCMTTESDEKLRSAIYGSAWDPLNKSRTAGFLEKVLDTLFERLAAEYLLKKKGVEIPTAALLKALQSTDLETAENAVRVLRFRTLGAEEKNALFRNIGRFKNPFSFSDDLFRLFKEQDKDDLPAVYRKLTEFSLVAEREGMGKHYGPSPYEEAHSSEARIARGQILGEMETGDERFVETVSLILKEDPFAIYRYRALDYFAKFAGERGRSELIKALRNPYRSVQAKAAEIVGQKGYEEARGDLESLLNSPSAKVRESARVALGKLGFPSEERAREQSPPASAVRMSGDLWARGLLESDILRICALPKDLLTPSSPPDPEPRESDFPPGVSIKEEKPYHQESGDVTRNWRISLTDPWRMSKLDQQSVQKRALQYAAGFGLNSRNSSLDPTGPFLFAGAMKGKDFESAERVYERMCDLFDTDEQMLDLGTTGLGWERFQQALSQYWKSNDSEALQSFHAVTSLKPFARPWSLLADYVEQSTSLSKEVQLRKKEKIIAEPPIAQKQAYIDYWIGRLKEINGIMPGQPASPLLWHALIEQYGFSPEYYKPRLPFATDKLRKAGLPALPKLLEVIDDQTPTRTVAYWRDFWPVRGLVSVGYAAREVIQAICDDYGLNPPKFLDRQPGGAYLSLNPALRAEFLDWYAKIPPDAAKLPAEARTKFVQDQRTDGGGSELSLHLPD